MYSSLKTTLMAALVFVPAALLSATQAQAGTIVPCGDDVCSSDFKIQFNGMDAGAGELLYDAKTGDISLNTAEESITGPGEATSGGGIMWTMGNGSTVSVGSLFGNADPILGFGLGASTAGAAGSTFGFTFNLPIALSGPINASSSVSYSLTALSGAGAQIDKVTGTNIVSAFEVDSDIGGLTSLNKGVDVGDRFFFTGGPQTQNSPVYTASNTFTGDLAYDLMVVKVDFSLSADSTVGLSGFVQQVVVPVPAAVWLFGSGLIGLIAVARRKKV